MCHAYGVRLFCGTLATTKRNYELGGNSVTLRQEQFVYNANKIRSQSRNHRRHQYNVFDARILRTFLSTTTRRWSAGKEMVTLADGPFVCNVNTQYNVFDARILRTFLSTTTRGWSAGSHGTRVWGVKLRLSNGLQFVALFLQLNFPRLRLRMRLNKITCSFLSTSRTQAS